MPLIQTYGSYIISKFNKFNIRTTSSRHPNIIQLMVGKLRQHMLQKVQSELTQDCDDPLSKNITKIFFLFKTNNPQ